MTDTDIVERPCPNCGHTLNGHSNLRHCGTRITHDLSTCMMFLRSDRDKAITALPPAVPQSFDDWWAADGHAIDPEPDVSWYDKRCDFAEMAFNAARTTTPAPVLGMSPAEIVAEFRKGCSDTQVKGRPAKDCETCLIAASTALQYHGFSDEDASLILRGQGDLLAEAAKVLLAEGKRDHNAIKDTEEAMGASYPEWSKMSDKYKLRMAGDAMARALTKDGEDG